MPRRPRNNTPGRVYHLISRMVDRNWFISSEKERRIYVDLLGRAVAQSDWRCLAYAVMSNHFHLAAVAGRQPLHSWIRLVHSPFAEWLNRTHDRIGSVFVRGPADYPIAPHRVRNVIAYIHKNPVRAGLCEVAVDSSWTSHRTYLGSVSQPWLDTTEGMARMGFDSPEEFDRWTNDPSSTLPSPDLRDPGAEPDVIPLASTYLADPNRPSAARIVEATAQQFGLALGQLRSKRRGANEVYGREVAIKCASMVGLTGVEIASALGISQQGESVIRRRIRDLDAINESCEQVLARLFAAK